MATIQRFVNTAADGTGDGTTNGTTGATGAFASLSSAEANIAPAAEDDVIIDCSGTAADTTGVTVDFATTPTSITIRANRSDAAGFHAGAALISTSHYRLVIGNAVTPLQISEGGAVTIDGLQIEVGDTGAGRAAINFSGSGSLTVRKTRLRNTASTDYGVQVGGGGSLARTLEMNLIVGFDVAGVRLNVAVHTSPTIEVRHQTIYGDGSSDGIQTLQPEGSGAATFNIKANAVANSGSGVDCTTSVVEASAVFNFQQNVFEQALGTTGEIALGTPANAWTNPGTAQTSDFTVKNTSSALFNVVNPTLVSTDITDATRDGTNHEAGAFDLLGGGGGGDVPHHAHYLLRNNLNTTLRM